MTKDDMPRFAKAMSYLAQSFKFSLSQIDLDIYWSQLQAYPIVSIEEAIFNYSRHPYDQNTMPTAGKIIAFIEGSSTTQAMQAWTKVLNAIRDKGPYQTVVFDDVIIHVVLSDMGGWIKTCELLEKDAPFRGHEFEKRYLGYLMRKPTTYPKRLIGIIDAVNSANGYEVTAIPVLIGDKDRAYHIYKTGIDNALQTFYTSLTTDLIVELERKRNLLLLEEKGQHCISLKELFNKNKFSR